MGQKIDKLDNDSRERHDAIYGKLHKLEERTSTLFKDVGEIKTGLNFVNEEVEDLKQSLKDKADLSKVAELTKKVDDLENRSKRNNVVFWNIPEGAENDSTCEELVSDILANHMGLERDIEIMRAHRTTIQNRPRSRNGAQLSRPIHVALLRYTDKPFILRNAATKLKDNPFQDAKFFISDDVSKAVRDERKKLKERHLESFHTREDVEYAFVPWSIPARILYKVNGSLKLKSFILSASDNSDGAD